MFIFTSTWYTDQYVLMSALLSGNGKKKKAHRRSFSDQNGYTGTWVTHTSTGQKLYSLQSTPEYPGSETHHDELPSLLGRCSAVLYRSAKKDPLATPDERRLFFVTIHNRIATKRHRQEMSLEGAAAAVQSFDEEARLLFSPSPASSPRASFCPLLHPQQRLVFLALLL